MGNQQSEGRPSVSGTPGGGGASSSRRGATSPTRPSTGGSATTRRGSGGRTRKLRTEYNVHGKILGEGHYGTVRLCCLADDPSKEFAVKSINKSRVSKSQMLTSEVEIMAKVDHPNIIKVVDIFDEKEFLHIVTELCTGGELFERIIEKSQTSERSFSELDAAKVLRQILDAVCYCHSLDPPVVHRDLKPENFLFKDKAENSPIKVIDFGLSKLAPTSDAGSGREVMHTRVGTPYYIAPEVLRREYTVKCDVWSVGVIAYILLCGYPPFYGDNDRDIFKRVSIGRFTFPSPEWDHISKQAKDFVASLLKVDVDCRPTARMAREHPFITRAASAASSTGGTTTDSPRTSMTNGPSAAAAPRPASAPAAAAMDQRTLEQEKLAAVARRMRRFVRMTKLKRLALNVLSRELTGSELQHLRTVFQKIDKDGNGKITAVELQEALADHLNVHQPTTGDEDAVMQLMQAIDLSGDQAIDYPEFLAATMQRNCYLREDNIKRVFEHLDLDSTGHITFQNLIDITGSKKHAADLLREADVNNDRKISYQEFKDIMTSKQ
mmetsp:Transcript_14496/g.57804  ORF Transcript_14496/g.57804 Transcript_14496/m.57804 type:complete len:551 (+) Transcript_14496:288-1940(+)